MASKGGVSRGLKAIGELVLLLAEGVAALGHLYR